MIFQKVYATPFSIVKADYNPKLLNTLNESKFDLATNSYVTRRFKIRYQVLPIFYSGVNDVSQRNLPFQDKCRRLFR